MQGTPAGLFSEVIEGAMQQAAQPGRQSMEGFNQTVKGRLSLIRHSNQHSYKNGALQLAHS